MSPEVSRQRKNPGQPAGIHILLKHEIGIYCSVWSAKREPPLCKGRWSKSSILTGGVVKERQSLSQKSEIFDSSLYTREPFRPNQQYAKLKFEHFIYAWLWRRFGRHPHLWCRPCATKGRFQKGFAANCGKPPYFPPSAARRPAFPAGEALPQPMPA